jgi:hypothetical protein
LVDEHPHHRLLAGLFDRFLSHVVEFSATAQGDGTCPNLNAVVWKVRDF